MKIELRDGEGVLVPEDGDIFYPCGCCWEMTEFGWMVSACAEHLSTVWQAFRKGVAA